MHELMKDKAKLKRDMSVQMLKCHSLGMAAGELEGYRDALLTVCAFRDQQPQGIKYNILEECYSFLVNKLWDKKRRHKEDVEKQFEDARKKWNIG